MLSFPIHWSYFLHSFRHCIWRRVESCAICLETFKHWNWTVNNGIRMCKDLDPEPEPTRVLACGHTFHAACLAKWERGTCPICRAPDVESHAGAPAAEAEGRRGRRRRGRRDLSGP